MEKKDDHKIPLPESTAGKIAYLAVMLGAAIIADRLEARSERKKAEKRRIEELKEEARPFSISRIAPHWDARNYDDCEIHGPHSEQCQASNDYHKSSNRCIDCHGGLGDGVSRWCMECDDEWEWYNGD